MAEIFNGGWSLGDVSWNPYTATVGPKVTQAKRASNSHVRNNVASISQQQVYPGRVGRWCKARPRLEKRAWFSKVQPNEEKVAFILDLVLSELAPLQFGHGVADDYQRRTTQ